MSYCKEFSSMRCEFTDLSLFAFYYLDFFDVEQKAGYIA